MASPALERSSRRPPGGDPLDHRQPARRVRRPHGEAVHRGRVERRQVDARERVLGQDPARGFLEGNRLDGQAHDALENQALCLLQGQELLHVVNKLLP